MTLRGELGLPGINSKPLSEFLIATQVRVDLGAMPSFGYNLIIDDRLASLIRSEAYARLEH